MIGLVAAYFAGRVAGRNDAELEEVDRRDPPRPVGEMRHEGLATFVFCALVAVFIVYALA